jgi:para-aminobenzoate synthetase/4-amino-4-deoxychorismate lyase
LAPDRRAQFNVAIRTVVVDKVTKLAEFGVGGGIVWDSRKDDEYEECQTKARVLTDRRPDFKLLESILWTPDIGYYLLDEHLQRLDESGKYFGFTVDLDSLRIELEFSTGSFLPRPLKVRVQVSKPGEIEINSIPVESQETVSLALAGEPINSGEVFLYHKTTHRQVYERAFIGLPDCEDVLLWNERGEITETTTANIVVEIEGKLLTPPVESGLLAGTYRNTLLNNGKLTEQILTLDDLSRRSSLFAINSVRRWRKAELIREPSLQRLSPP